MLLSGRIVLVPNDRVKDFVLELAILLMIRLASNHGRAKSADIYVVMCGNQDQAVIPM